MINLPKASGSLQPHLRVPRLLLHCEGPSGAMANSSLSQGCCSSPCVPGPCQDCSFLSPSFSTHWRVYLRATPPALASLVLLEQSFAAFLGAPRGCQAPNATSQIVPCCRTVCCALERQQVPNAVTPVTQMSLHCAQGPSQGSSGGTLPCHLIGFLSCTPHVSKQFIDSNQVCHVIPHWGGM